MSTSTFVLCLIATAVCAAKAKIAEPYTLLPWPTLAVNSEVAIHEYQENSVLHIVGAFSRVCYVSSAALLRCTWHNSQTRRLLNTQRPLSPWLPAFTTITGRSERHCQGRRGTQGRENADPNDHHRHDVRPAAGDGDICRRHAVKAETQEGLIRR